MVMNSLLTVCPNLKELTMDRDIGLELDGQKLRGLKYLKLTTYPVERYKGLLNMINAVSKTLETLELCHSAEFGNLLAVSIGEEPTFQALLSLKEVKLELRRNVVGIRMTLWEMILGGRAPCFETLNVICHQPFTYPFVYDFLWKPLFATGWIRPLTSLKTLKVLGQGGHQVPQFSETERLGKLQYAFPNLSNLAYPICISLCHRAYPMQVILEVLVALGRWDNSFKEIQLGIYFDCSMNNVAAVFEALGEVFFTNGLESLCLLLEWRRAGTAEIVQREEEYERLTRTLLWTRNMKRVAFQEFGVTFYSILGLRWMQWWKMFDLFSHPSKFHCSPTETIVLLLRQLFSEFGANCSHCAKNIPYYKIMDSIKKSDEKTSRPDKRRM